MANYRKHNVNMMCVATEKMQKHLDFVLVGSAFQILQPNTLIRLLVLASFRSPFAPAVFFFVRAEQYPRQFIYKFSIFFYQVRCVCVFRIQRRMTSNAQHTNTETPYFANGRHRHRAQQTPPILGFFATAVQLFVFMCSMENGIICV